MGGEEGAEVSSAQCSKGVKLKNPDFPILLAQMTILVNIDPHELKFSKIFIKKMNFVIR